MSLQESLRSAVLAILVHPTFQQIAPLIVIFIVPLLVLTLSSTINWGSHLSLGLMVFESLWNWGSSQSSSSGPERERRKLKRKNVRTRAEQVAQNAHVRSDHASHEVDTKSGYYPGLVNISGTYCFMNSTVQALASLSYLQPHLDAIHAKAGTLNVPTPVTDTLRELLNALNNPHRHPSSIRPQALISALSHRSSNSSTSHARSGASLFSSREHQDAQELFQLLSECIKDESAAIDREDQRDRGLAALPANKAIRAKVGMSPFDGLTANRRSCVQCGYTEAVMHFAFDSWQLAVPRFASVHLEECLADYTRLEVLNDCVCRKCSMIMTHRRLHHEAERLAEDENPSPSKKKRVREARKLEARVKEALDSGRIEDDIRGVKMEKVVSKASTKQAMIARPPPVLALHINRSMHYGAYATKNNVHIVFPEILDLTPFITSGSLSTVPSVPISSPAPLPPSARSTTPTPATYSNPRTLYRLSAVVCHYGQHSFGHYVAFRRRPRRPESGSNRFAPPRLAHRLGCDCEQCLRLGPIHDVADEEQRTPVPGTGWMRISDDSVRECGIETVLQEGSGAFMLYYEQVVHPRPTMYSLKGPSSASEETLKPESRRMLNGDPSVSTSSLLSTDDVSSEQLASTKVLGPRIVRSVAAKSGRDRNGSVPSATSSRGVTPRTYGTSSTVSSPSSEGELTPRLEHQPPLQNGSAATQVSATPNGDTKSSPTRPAPTTPGISTRSTSSDNQSHPHAPRTPVSRQSSGSRSQPRTQTPQPVRSPSGPAAQRVGLAA